MESIYNKLAQHLDNLPGGYPATESGIELRILKRLFTPEEAEIAVHLTLMPESAAAIAQRIGVDELTCHTRGSSSDWKEKASSNLWRPSSWWAFGNIMSMTLMRN